MNPRGAMLTVLAAASLVAGCAPKTGFDPVIEGGRVMDPESGLDGVRNVGTRPVARPGSSRLTL